MSYRFLLILSLLLSSLHVHSQGTLDDYNRAYALGKKLNYGRVDNANINPHWIDGTDYVWYVLENDGKKTYEILNCNNLKSSPL